MKDVFDSIVNDREEGGYQMYQNNYHTMLKSYDWYIQEMYFNKKSPSNFFQIHCIYMSLK